MPAVVNRWTCFTSLPLTCVSDFGLGRILIGIPTSSQALLHRVHPGGQGVLGESWDQQLSWDRKWGTLLSSLSVSDGPELCALPPALPRPLLHSSLAAQWLHAPQHENCSLARRNHRGAGKNNPSGLGELKEYNPGMGRFMDRRVTKSWHHYYFLI